VVHDGPVFIGGGPADTTTGGVAVFSSAVFRTTRFVGARFLGATALVIGSLLAAGCSEPEPAGEADPAPVDDDVTCVDESLIECARDSTIAELVPDQPVQADSEPIVLGMVNQENTPAGSYPELSQAARAAIQFVNEQLGGIDGRPIELEVCNTNFSAEGSTACAQRFVDAEVPVVLGGIDVFGTAIDVLADNGVPYAGGIPISTQSVQLPNSFQWSGGTWGATVAFAHHASEELGAQRVSIVYGEFGSIAQSAEYGASVLERAGVEVQLVPYPIVSTDVSSPLQAAASSDPDAIFMLAADAGCAGGFDAIRALEVAAQKYFVGACAAPTIIESVDVAATDGTIFNIEGPISTTTADPDIDLYNGVILTYGAGLDPIGAGTVSFRSFMNVYSILRGLGADQLDPTSITEALAAQVETPSFMGHAYTCDRAQFEGLPAMCSPQQILARMDDRDLSQLGDWIDVGSVYES
jgi:branched-chain amino acid transport system substrate-binding protein